MYSRRCYYEKAERGGTGIEHYVKELSFHFRPLKYSSLPLIFTPTHDIRQRLPVHPLARTKGCAIARLRPTPIELHAR